MQEEFRRSADHLRICGLLQITEGVLNENISNNRVCHLRHLRACPPQEGTYADPCLMEIAKT